MWRDVVGSSDAQIRSLSLVISLLAVWLMYDVARLKHVQRNRTVCALSRAVILIESGLEGGTFNAGETARSLGIPLLVIDFISPPESAEGNRHFLACGAIGLHPHPSGNVDIEPVLDAVLTATVTSQDGNGWLFADVMPGKKRRKTRRSAS